MLNLRMREQIRHAVVGQAELRSGRLPGAQRITVAFADIVGFTSFGEQAPSDELGCAKRRARASPGRPPGATASRECGAR
jgi:class 3 adenylate cyclase